MQQLADLGSLPPVQRPQFADTVFEALHRKILYLELPPGTRLSEVNVASAMGVSRQPVRDAFYRLSKLGFLTIRPQRATYVSPISIEAVMQARFVREAIELACIRAACVVLSEEDFTALEAILTQQEQALAERESKIFHDLDDRFHREICIRSGHGFAWEVLRENKAHMDRVRFLSLSFAREEAHHDHWHIIDALRARDIEASVSRMSDHLSRIKLDLPRIRAEHAAYFEDAAA